MHVVTLQDRNNNYSRLGFRLMTHMSYMSYVVKTGSSYRYNIF